MPARLRSTGAFVAGASLLLFGLGYGLYAWRAEPQDRPVVPSSVEQNSTADESAETGEQQDGLEIPVTPTPPDQLTPEQIRKIVAGQWTSQYYGTRYLTVRNDGTATILFKANTMASMVVGSRLKIEYTWEYDPDKERVIFTMVDGGPESGIEYVRKLWGNQQRQDVLHVSANELHLRDLDGKTEHHWVTITGIPEKVQKQFADL